MVGVWHKNLCLKPTNIAERERSCAPKEEKKLRREPWRWRNDCASWEQTNLGIVGSMKSSGWKENGAAGGIRIEGSERADAIWDVSLATALAEEGGRHWGASRARRRHSRARCYWAKSSSGMKETYRTNRRNVTNFYASRKLQHVPESYSRLLSCDVFYEFG